MVESWELNIIPFFVYQKSNLELKGKSLSHKSSILLANKAKVVQKDNYCTPPYLKVNSKISKVKVLLVIVVKKT